MSEKNKNQLHQLLAVENDRKQQAINIMNETVATFQKKPDHFDGMRKDYHAVEEDGMKIPPEYKEIVTTVKDKLNYSEEAVIKAIDAHISKEETNSSGGANAVLKIGDTEFNLSATSLLALESHLIKIRNMYKAIPTLDPAKKWSKDEMGIYNAEPSVTYRTEKQAKVIQLAKATDRHAEQATLVNEDVQVGHYITVNKSGKVKPKQKSDLLANIDKLIDAVKVARAKANQAEVENVKIGKKIFDYINKNILG